MKVLISMPCLPRLLRRSIHFFLLAFLALSLLYSTNLLLISPLWDLAWRKPSLSATSGGFTFLFNGPRHITPSIHARRAAGGTLESQTGTTQISAVKKPVYPPTSPVVGSGSFDFHSSEFVLRHGLGHRQPIRVDQETMLAKAFAGSMRPSNIIPYFYRAQGVLDEEEVTVTTLITSNRFEVFERLVEKYQGPISVTVHIKDVQEHVQAVLDTLHKMYTSSPLMTAYVDVHLVVDNFDRQFNTWRNIARMFARTQYIMMLDIDFYPCTDFRTLLKEGREPDSVVNRTMLEMMRNGRAALVIPAFEYRDFEAGTKFRDFPTKKNTLLSLAKKKRINMFHASWGPGHNSSDYDQFYAASPGEVYKVTQYQSAYEPYVIFKRDGPPLCDERFVGYGGNKAACLFEMYLAGISYYVLADHFMIHQNHLYEETARRNERNHNRKVYADFREETCIKYLNYYQDSRKIKSDQAANAIAECKKIKSVARSKKYFRDAREGL